MCPEKCVRSTNQPCCPTPTPDPFYSSAGLFKDESLLGASRKSVKATAVSHSCFAVCHGFVAL